MNYCRYENALHYFKRLEELLNTDEQGLAMLNEYEFKAVGKLYELLRSFDLDMLNTAIAEAEYIREQEQD